MGESLLGRERPKHNYGNKKKKRKEGKKRRNESEALPEYLTTKGEDKQKKEKMQPQPGEFSETCGARRGTHRGKEKHESTPRPNCKR